MLIWESWQLKIKDDIKDNIQSFGKVIISFVVVKDEKRKILLVL